MHQTLREFAHWISKHQFVRDAITTALLCALWILMAVSANIPISPGLFVVPSQEVSLLWSVVLTIPMLARRTHPIVSAYLFTAFACAQLFFGPSIILADIFAIPILITVVSNGSQKEQRICIWIACIMCIIASGIGAFVGTYGPVRAVNDTSFAFLPHCSTAHSQSSCFTSFSLMFIMMLVTYLSFIAVSIAYGFWSRSRHLSAHMIQERNASILARQDEEQRIAALAERARIARDMHDVVAHTLSIIIVQSDGGRYAACDDPELAVATMRTIKHESEHALHDMNRVLSVLGGSPHADYNDIATLIDQATAVAPHMKLRRTIHGTAAPDALLPAQSEALYHVVQESLTNIRKYAGLHVHVNVDEYWDDDGVRIDICDNGRGASADLDGHEPGTGLIGLRERVEEAQGSLLCGPRLSGGFQVKASIPLTAHESHEYAPIPHEEPTKSNLTRITHLIHQETSTRTKEHSESDNKSHNWIERLSSFTQQHPFIVDCITVAILVTILSPIMASILMYPLHDYSYITPVYKAWSLLCLLPLIIRRTHPKWCALLIACICTVQIIGIPYIYFANIVAVFCAIYSVWLYASKRERTWVITMISVDSILLLIKMIVDQCGYTSIAQCIMRVIQTHSLMSPAHGFRQLDIFFIPILALVVCATAILSAAWQRINSSNVMVLQAREEALIQEIQKRRVLAANMERDRISAAIQEEVSQTLSTVINQTSNEIITITHTMNTGAHVQSADIALAFKKIGAQGREALAHMRQLLGILRQTGFSDEAETSTAMQLKPAQSLDEQLMNNKEA